MKRFAFVFFTVIIAGMLAIGGCGDNSNNVSNNSSQNATLRNDVNDNVQTQQKDEFTLNGHEFVDLGLPSGLLWATCNVGATSPEDYGDYFAWGEDSTKTTYGWSTYRYCNGDYDKLSKYCNYSDYGNNGFTDTLTTLEASDDAATANWGAAWRMPTMEEFNELKTNCTVTRTTQNGINGNLFTGPNGNSIFLPASGDREGSELSGVGSYGYYWSSSLLTDCPYFAWLLGFNSDYYLAGGERRYYGFSVRAVCPSQN